MAATKKGFADLRGEAGGKRSFPLYSDRDKPNGGGSPKNPNPGNSKKSISLESATSTTNQKHSFCLTISKG